LDGTEESNCPHASQLKLGLTSQHLTPRQAVGIKTHRLEPTTTLIRHLALSIRKRGKNGKKGNTRKKGKLGNSGNILILLITIMGCLNFNAPTARFGTGSRVQNMLTLHAINGFVPIRMPIRSAQAGCLLFFGDALIERNAVVLPCMS
jgi:hypothetical protein